jgi:hypothetical protein
MNPDFENNTGLKVGDLIREIETDPLWILYSGSLGVLVRPADADMGLRGLEGIHHWLVAWGNGCVQIVNIDDIEGVKNESR